MTASVGRQPLFLGDIYVTVLLASADTSMGRWLLQWRDECFSRESTLLQQRDDSFNMEMTSSMVRQSLYWKELLEIHLTGETITSLEKQSLHWGDNCFTGEILTSLGKQSLHWGDNDFTGEIITLSRRQQLHWGDNNFTGETITSLGRQLLQWVYWLCQKDDSFTGVTVTSLGRLSLYLGDNSLWRCLLHSGNNHSSGETITLTSLGRLSLHLGDNQFAAEMFAWLWKQSLLWRDNHNHFTGDLVGRQSFQWGDNCITGMEEIDGGGVIISSFFWKIITMEWRLYSVYQAILLSVYELWFMLGRIKGAMIPSPHPPPPKNKKQNPINWNTFGMSVCECVCVVGGGGGK